MPDVYFRQNIMYTPASKPFYDNRKTTQDAYDTDYTRQGIIKGIKQ